MQQYSYSILFASDGVSNKICLLTGVKESDWVLDLTSSTSANLLSLQMSWSDNCGCGQIPLIKVTMAETLQRWVGLLWDAHFALITGNLERKG